MGFRSDAKTDNTILYYTDSFVALKKKKAQCLCKISEVDSDIDAGRINTSLQLWVNQTRKGWDGKLCASMPKLYMKLANHVSMHPLILILSR